MNERNPRRLKIWKRKCLAAVHDWTTHQLLSENLNQFPCPSFVEETFLIDKPEISGTFISVLQVRLSVCHR